MKKEIILCLAILLAMDTASIAQIPVSKVVIDVSGIEASNFYYRVPPSGIIEFDTVISNSTFYLNTDEARFKLNGFWDNAGSSEFTDSIGRFLVNLSVTIWPPTQRIYQLVASQVSEYWDQTITSVYHRDYNSVSIDSMVFVESKAGDTLKANLDANALRKHSFTIINSSGWEGAHDGIVFNGNALRVTDNAYFKVIIIGNFPLSVHQIQDGKKDRIFIDAISKFITVSTCHAENRPLTAFDLLGRKHNLDFLSSDNTSATYSFRSLQPGVYFVNDGREAVKFMITE